MFDSGRSGILKVALSTLSLPIDADFTGLGDLNDPVVRKELLPYVIVEYENYQVSIDAVGGWLYKSRSVGWMSRNSHWFGFNVPTPSDFTVHMIVKKHNASGTAQLLPIGSAKLNLFAEAFPSSPKSVVLQTGRGRIYLNVSYTDKALPPLDDRREWSVPFLRVGSTDLLHLKEENVSRNYAMKTIENVDVASKLEIAHPFIAPLQFSIKAPEKLSLLSPMASGGYLFSHLQKQRRFDVNMSRLYAAELLCVFEYLHDHGITFACMRPEHILVDAFGHINICKPDVFILDAHKKGHILPGRSEIAAPELFLDQQQTSRTMDWWSLGIFLYEMLTGLFFFS